VAALLAVLDQRWCQRELVAALVEPEIEVEIEIEMEIEIRNRNRPTLVAALRHSASEIARRRTQAHDIPPSHEPRPSATRAARSLSRRLVGNR
jgi:hypothetical protein